MSKHDVCIDSICCRVELLVDKRDFFLLVIVEELLLVVITNIVSVLCLSFAPGSSAIAVMWAGFFG